MISRRDVTGALVFEPYLELDYGKYQVAFNLNAVGGKMKSSARSM